MTTIPAKLSPLLTIPEVAEHLKVDTRTISRRIKDGKIRVHRFGRLVRVSPEDLASFINTHHM
jgi:excisionase family DNA binding protein